MYPTKNEAKMNPYWECEDELLIGELCIESIVIVVCDDVC